MTRKTLAIASLAMILAMLGIAAWLGASLPADARLPIHWGLNGQPDGFAGKWVALLTPPAVTAFVGLLFYFLPSLEPRREGLARSQGLYLWGWASILPVCAIIELTLVSAALGWDLPVDRLLAGGVGAMLVTIGNQLGKSRSMYLVGIRTPWTLASEEVWIRTHRLGGKLMVAGGLVMVAAALLPIPSGALGGTILVVILVAAFAPILYSWLLWRREVRQEPQDQSSL
jgi:uncharacterized membrane protein